MEAKQMHNNRKWSRNLIFKIYHICWVLWEGIQFCSIAVAHIDKWKRKVFLWGIYSLIFCPPIAVFSSLSSPVVFSQKLCCILTSNSLNSMIYRYSWSLTLRKAFKNRKYRKYTIKQSNLQESSIWWRQIHGR